MGAYNTVKFSMTGRDGLPQEVIVQFKYGEVRQHEYKIQDRILWGGRGNDVGDPCYKKVVVDGCIESPLDFIYEDFEVHIEDGIIKDVVPSSGKYNFVNSKDTYIVVGK